jgi:hypothetical protein
LELGNTRKFSLLCPDRSGFPKILPFSPISGQFFRWEYCVVFHRLAVERHDILNWTTLFRALGFHEVHSELLSVSIGSMPLVGKRTWGHEAALAGRASRILIEIPGRVVS